MLHPDFELGQKGLDGGSGSKRERERKAASERAGESCSIGDFEAINVISQRESSERGKWR